MVDEAIRMLTASRAGTQARCQHRSEAEFPNTRFKTLDCSVAQLGRLETRRGEEKRNDLKESFPQKKRDENAPQEMLAYKEAFWGFLYFEECI